MKGYKKKYLETKKCKSSWLPRSKLLFRHIHNDWFRSFLENDLLVDNSFNFILHTRVLVSNPLRHGHWLFQFWDLPTQDMMSDNEQRVTLKRRIRCNNFYYLFLSLCIGITKMLRLESVQRYLKVIHIKEKTVFSNQSSDFLSNFIEITRKVQTWEVTCFIFETCPLCSKLISFGNFNSMISCAFCIPSSRIINK